MNKMILTLLLSTLFYSCGNSQEFKEAPLSPIINNLETTTFEDVKAEVFEASCIQCHSTYDQYDVISSDLDAITNSIRSLRMPKNGSLTSQQMDVFNKWISAGAPGPTTTVAPQKPIELEATYESVNQLIFAKRCTVCHSPQGQVPFLDLSSRFAIFEQRNYLLDFENPDRSYLLEVIQDPFEPMPPKDSPFEQLSDKEIKVLQRWIGLGMP